MQEFTPVAFRIRASDYPQAHVTKPAPDSGHHFMAKLFETYDVWKMAKGADIKNLQLFVRGHGNKPAQVYFVGYHHCAIGGCSFGDGLLAVFLRHRPNSVIAGHPPAFEFEPFFVLPPACFTRAALGELAVEGEREVMLDENGGCVWGCIAEVRQVREFHLQ